MPQPAQKTPPRTAGASETGKGEDDEATPKGLPTSDRYDAETAHVDETHDPRKTADDAKTRAGQGRGA